jgi:hypothetical protein
MQCKRHKAEVELYASNVSFYSSHRQTLPGTKGCQKPLEQDTLEVPLQHFHYPGNLREDIGNTISC